MAYEKKNYDIAVFKQRDKKNPKGPDWKGDALIDGIEYEVAFWEKGDKGTMLAGQIKVARKSEKPARKPDSQAPLEDDGDIPF